MRAETRRSEGEVAALMAPMVPDRDPCRHNGFRDRTRLGQHADNMRPGAVGSYLFDAGPLNTYTHLSLAFTSRTVPAPGPSGEMR
ncbi:hypothetical protein GCM10009647_084200 [Streptomyces sanglieri]